MLSPYFVLWVPVRGETGLVMVGSFSRSNEKRVGLLEEMVRLAQKKGLIRFSAIKLESRIMRVILQWHYECIE